MLRSALLCSARLTHLYNHVCRQCEAGTMVLVCNATLCPPPGLVSIGGSTGTIYIDTKLAYPTVLTISRLTHPLLPNAKHNLLCLYKPFWGRNYAGFLAIDIFLSVIHCCFFNFAMFHKLIYHKILQPSFLCRLSYYLGPSPSRCFY